MNLLIDTHVFIWYSMASDRLSKTAVDAINDEANAVFISQVSIWEMQIKHDLGKLALPMDVKSMVEGQIGTNDFQLLQIQNEHFWRLAHLPNAHKDPFDRLLICQAQVEELALITCDSKIASYDVNILW